MAQFIVLKQSSGKPIGINLDKVKAFYPADDVPNAQGIGFHEGTKAWMTEDEATDPLLDIKMGVLENILKENGLLIEEKPVQEEH